MQASLMNTTINHTICMQKVHDLALKMSENFTGADGIFTGSNTMESSSKNYTARNKILMQVVLTTG